jgi:mono/diheme cytochrome c family protein/plastocyanin
MWTVVLIIGIGTAVTLGWLFWPRAVTVQAARPEAGGWMPDTLTAQVGEPLRLRLTAVDMMHGFTVGQIEMEPVDIPPGEVTEITLLFDEPGTYTYYCTRFCGPTHWRMRGTIEVLGDEPQTVTRPESPLYVTLGLDIDAPHPAEVSWTAQPDAGRGETLSASLPAAYLTREIYEAQSPAAVWQQLREEPAAAGLTDAEVWDTVAYAWRSQTTPDKLAAGQALYETNCVFCHGPDGAGDGPLATLQPTAVPDFTDPDTMLGASSAVLQGKILRGGMGTGMPNWGTVFTDEQIGFLVDYLWTFQFPTAETTAETTAD